MTTQGRKVAEAVRAALDSHPHPGMQACEGCGEPAWPENNPCDKCQKKTKQAETPASSSPRPKVQGATSRKG